MRGEKLHESTNPQPWKVFNPFEVLDNTSHPALQIDVCQSQMT